MIDSTFPQLRSRHRRENIAALAEVFNLQREDVKARLATGAPTLLSRLWDERLAEVMFDRNKSTATEVGRRIARALGGEFNPDVMDAWLRKNAERGAANINDSTRESLAEVSERDEVDELFDTAETSRAAMLAAGMVTAAANFGAQDGAKSTGQDRGKMWVVNSGNPRSSHAAMNGQVVSIHANFPNGMAWPGDSAGGPDELANCQCSLAFL